MTDFVLEKWNEDLFLDEYTKVTHNYANFLKQPLTLGMFVSCDEDGNVLEQPIYTTNHSDECYCKKCEEETKRCSDLQDQYQKAKEKVLFEKCEFDGIDVLINKSIYISSFKNFHNLTVENLIYTSVKLTENALKQIGL